MFRTVWDSIFSTFLYLKWHLRYRPAVTDRKLGVLVLEILRLRNYELKSEPWLLEKSSMQIARKMHSLTNS